MSFSTEWEQQYQSNAHMSIWPWSDLVSFFYRHVRPITPELRVLELGCGAGANIPFFKRLGVEYFAIDGSETIVEKLKGQYPELAANIVAGDFTQRLPFAGEFDVVVDRASLTSNSTQAIERCLDAVYHRLKPNGKYIGIDWYSTAYSDYKKGVESDDAFTRTGFEEGSFAGLGRVHFSDKPHLLELFKSFEMMVLEHKEVQREIPDDGWQFASWNFVARKV